MKLALYSCLATLAFASTTQAATLYVSPTGTATSGCTRSTPCDLGSGVGLAMAGDTVILMEGVYTESLYVTNSGTADAWITFQADECATPIIEGSGVGPNDDNQATGVGSAEAEYLRFRGIVARGWNIGFGNGWAGGVESDEESNGHWDIEHCISYSNGRTGFTFFSAEDFTLKHSISAHNGSSQLHSWSSGVTLFEAHGTNLVEGNVSFENTDAERNTDGSGFIVDEEANGATFINNIAFGNAGSCLRLTKSSGTRFINNTCYHNSQFGSRATGPTNPGEIYFTNGGVTQENVLFMNNVIVGTGEAPAGSDPIVNQPPSGWTNNVATTGSVTYFTDPTGDSPSFVPASGEMTLTGQGSTGNGVPMTDIGFDPKCIVKRSPTMVGDVAAESWWQYDIDIDYIKSIGGVAKCFNPTMRVDSPAIGAYAPSEVTTVMPGSCEPAEDPDPIGGAGGMAGAGGMDAAGTAGMSVGGTGEGGSAMGGSGMGGATAGEGVGGANTDGGMAMGGTDATAGASNGGAANGAGMAGTAAAGTSTLPGAGTSESGMGQTGAAASGNTGAGAVSGGGDGAPQGDPAGCGCRVGFKPSPRGLLSAFSVGLLLCMRRRRVRIRSVEL